MSRENQHYNGQPPPPEQEPSRDAPPEQNRGDSNRRPSHVAFQVREGEDGKAYFNRIGSAWPHKDGEGYSLLLDATPVDGRVTLRTPQERVKETRQPRETNQGQRDPALDYDR